jgi:hypothetical protein
MVKSIRMRWAGHVEFIGKMKNSYKILFGNPQWKRPLEELNTDGG